MKSIIQYALGWFFNTEIGREVFNEIEIRRNRAINNQRKKAGFKA